jgi:lysyl-tRNA synthetase class 2
MNFAAFREALELGQRIGAGPVLRAWRQVLLFLSRWLQIEARYKFLARFRPAWAPRFLVCPGPAAIPRVTVAALHAEALPTGLAASLRRLARLSPAQHRALASRVLPTR